MRASPPSAGPPAASRVFRPLSGLIAAGVGGLIAVAWAGVAVADGGWSTLAGQAPAMLLMGSVAYAVLVRPAVEVGPAGVRLRNVVRDVDVPWAALAEVRTRYALTLGTTDGRRFTAWAAPAAGRHADTRLTRREFELLDAGFGAGPGGSGGGGSSGGQPTASASIESPSGAVALWVRREWLRAMTTSSDADAPHGAAVGTEAAVGGAAKSRPAPAVITLLTASAALFAANLFS